MATITFILIFYSISIRVVIIYRLIQELGSIRMILGIAIGLHLPLQVIVAYKIGIPPIHYWLVILVKYFHNRHLFWWIITLHKLWTIFLYVNCSLYILEIRFMILLWSILLVLSCTSVIELIVYSSSFVVIDADDCHWYSWRYEISNTVVTTQDQTYSLTPSKLIPRQLNTDTSMLIAPKIELNPAKCILKIAISTLAPILPRLDVKGGYL